MSFLGVQRALLPLHHLSHSQSLEAFLSRPSPFRPTFSSPRQQWALLACLLPTTLRQSWNLQPFSLWLPVLIPQSQLGGPDGGAMGGRSEVWESYCSELGDLGWESRLRGRLSCARILGPSVPKSGVWGTRHLLYNESGFLGLAWQPRLEEGS